MHKELLMEIEKCRDQMIRLTSSYDFTSDAVVNMSKNLDVLLNNLDKVQCNSNK